MKEITIDGRNLQYDTYYDEYDGSVITYFYEGTHEVVISKWSWKNLKIIKIVKILPKSLFSINRDSKDVRLTRKWWETEIRKGLSENNRSEEIKRGELI